MYGMEKEKIYEVKELTKPNLFYRILGKLPAKNGIVEMNNIFAEHENDLRKIKIEDILEIAAKYKINLKKSYRSRRFDLYKRYFIYCLKDNKLEDFEIEALKHISEVLHLDKDEIQEFLEFETEKIYLKNVKDAVEDGILEDWEKEKLERLKKDLLISESKADKMYKTNALEILKDYIAKAMSDKRISPEEETEIKKIADSLEIEHEHDENTKKVLDKFKLYWEIENGELPVIESDIELGSGEILHFKTESSYTEHDEKTEGKSIPGMLYLTNQRIIFKNDDEKEFLLNEMKSFKSFNNGINVECDNLTGIFLAFKNEVDIFSMIINRLKNRKP